MPYEQRDLFLHIVARRHDDTVIDYDTFARFIEDAHGNEYLLLKRPDDSWTAPKRNEVPTHVWDAGAMVLVKSALPDLLNYFTATRKG